MIARLAQITAEQVDSLYSIKNDNGAYFNPIEIAGNWYLSENEINACTTIEWVKELEVIEVEIELIPSIHDEIQQPLH